MPDRPAWGYSDDDMHVASHLGRNWNVMILPGLSHEDLRREWKRDAAISSARREACRVGSVLVGLARRESESEVPIDAISRKDVASPSRQPREK